MAQRVSKTCKPFLPSFSFQFLCSVCDYWLFSFIQRKVFHRSRPKTIPELKLALIEAVRDINENHRDMICKAMKNFLVIHNRHFWAVEFQAVK